MSRIELNSCPFMNKHISSEAKKHIVDNILPLIKFSGYKQEEKKKIAIQCIYNLYLCGIDECWVSESRRKTKPGVRLRVEVWDAIIKAKLAAIRKGSEISKRVTRYGAKRKLLKFFVDKPLNMENKKRSENMKTLSKGNFVLIHTDGKDSYIDRSLAIVHTGNEKSFVNRLGIKNVLYEIKTPEGKLKGPIPHEAFNENYQALLLGGAYVIGRMNSENANHSWKAYKFNKELGKDIAYQPSMNLRWVHSGGGVGLFARIYTNKRFSAQSIPPKERQYIEIDGEAVSELDYSGHYLHMIYNKAGLNPEGDVYKPELILPKFYSFKNASDDKKEIIRDFVKEATNTCLNAQSQKKANSAVCYSLKEHPKSKWLFKLIYKLEKTDVIGIVDRILAAHADIEKSFFNVLESKLRFTTDSIVMLNILFAFVEAEKPVLPIHDSVVVRRSDKDFARKVMEDEYKALFNYPPVIKEEF